MGGAGGGRWAMPPYRGRIAARLVSLGCAVLDDTVYIAADEGRRPQLHRSVGECSWAGDAALVDAGGQSDQRARLFDPRLDNMAARYDGARTGSRGRRGGQTRRVCEL